MHSSNATTCEVCGRHMATARALTSHLRIHTGDRPFECTQCGRTYLSNDALGHHKRSKHGQANSQGNQLNLCLSNIKRNSFQKQTKHPYNTWWNKGKEQDKTTKAESDKWKIIGDGKHGTGEITQSVFMSDDVSSFKDTEKNPEIEQLEVNRKRGDKQINLNYVPDNVPKPSVDVTCYNSDKNHIDRHLEFESQDLNTQRCNHDNEDAIVGSAWECNRGSYDQCFGMHKNPKVAQQSEKQILEKTYTSNSCPLSFAINKGFEKRVKSSNCQTGSETRLFECVVCDKVYISRWRLTRHMRTHTAEKPSQCDVCEKRFSRRDHMLTHIKRVHKLGENDNAVLSTHKFDVT